MNKFMMYQFKIYTDELLVNIIFRAFSSKYRADLFAEAIGNKLKFIKNINKIRVDVFSKEMEEAIKDLTLEGSTPSEETINRIYMETESWNIPPV